MRILVYILLICIAGFLYNRPDLWQQNITALLPSAVRNMIFPPPVAQSSMVYMYSVTYSGPSKIMERKLIEAGIQFVQYKIDADPARASELNQRMISAGYTPSNEMPVIFAGRKVFIGPTSISNIQDAIK